MMNIAADLVDRYQTTIIDFWRLRPRGFLNAILDDPHRYLTPAQFLGISCGQIMALTAVAHGLAKHDIGTIIGREPPDANAVAGRVVVWIFTSFIAGTLFYRLISPRWPIRARKPFTSYFSFYCYAMAVFVPAAAVDVVLDPIVFALVGSGGAPTWLLLLPGLVGYVLGIPIFYIYVNPGIACINGISSIRMLMGTAFWALATAIPLGGVLGVILWHVIGRVSGFSGD